MALVWAASASGAAAVVCGTAPFPAYPAPGRDPIVQTWADGHGGELAAPACDGLRSRQFDVLVRITGTLQGPADAAGLLARLGAVSTLRGMTYWSFSASQREVLITEAYAIDALATRQPRPDFTATELRSRGDLYFIERDNRLSTQVPFRLTLVDDAGARLRVGIENAGKATMAFFTVLDVGDMQTSIVLERLGPGLWGYKCVSGLLQARFGMLNQNRLSYASRSVAMFDQLSGRRTEIEYLR